jgi:hypothetical protein
MGDYPKRRNEVNGSNRISRVPGRDSRSQRLRNKRKRARRTKRAVYGVLSAALAGLLTLWINSGLSYINRMVEESKTLTPSVSGPWPHPSHGSRPVTHGPTASGPNSESQGQTALCKGLRVTQSPIDSWRLLTWTFRDRYFPSTSQLAQLNRDRGNASLTNRDLYDDEGFAPFVFMQVVVQNQCLSAVTITNVAVSRVCSHPNAATIFYDGTAEPAGGGLPGDTQLGFRLDSPDPDAMLASNWNSRDWKHEYDQGPRVTIPPNGVQTFDIRAVADDASCAFEIVWTAWSSSHKFQEVLTDDGQPFRVSSLLLRPINSGRYGKSPFYLYHRLYVYTAPARAENATWKERNPANWQ